MADQKSKNINTSTVLPTSSEEGSKDAGNASTDLPLHRLHPGYPFSRTIRNEDGTKKTLLLPTTETNTDTPRPPPSTSKTIRPATPLNIDLATTRSTPKTVTSPDKKQVELQQVDMCVDELLKEQEVSNNFNILKLSVNTRKTINNASAPEITTLLQTWEKIKQQLLTTLELLKTNLPQKLSQFSFYKELTPDQQKHYMMLITENINQTKILKEKLINNSIDILSKALQDLNHIDNDSPRKSTANKNKK